MACRVLTVTENLQSVSPERAAELMEREGYVRTHPGQPQPSTAPDQRSHSYGSCNTRGCPSLRLTCCTETPSVGKYLLKWAEQKLAVLASRHLPVLPATTLPCLLYPASCTCRPACGLPLAAPCGIPRRGAAPGRCWWTSGPRRITTRRTRRAP